MNKYVFRSALLAISVVLSGAANALCMSDAELFKKMGLNATAAPGNQMDVTFPRENTTGTIKIRRSYKIVPEDLSGRIKSMTVADENGARGTPPIAHEYVMHFASHVEKNYFPSAGSLTRAQVFVELEGSNRIIGLVMLNTPTCIESNRAMFESLRTAYEKNWPVSLTILRARLLDVTVDYNETEGRIIEDISPNNGLISVVTVRPQSSTTSVTSPTPR